MHVVCNNHIAYSSINSRKFSGDGKDLSSGDGEILTTVGCPFS